MNSTTTKNDNKIKIDFPCLMESEGKSILMVIASTTDKLVGTIVHGGDENELGSYSNNWNRSLWKSYNGKVTLT